METASSQTTTPQVGTLFQGFWSGRDLSLINRACLRSFIAAGHTFDLYSYDTLSVPDGVSLRNAAEIVPRSELFLFDNPNTGRPDVAPFADYFRLRLLANRGGWYCDVDTVCLSSTVPTRGRIWAQAAPEFERGTIGNGEIHFDVDDPLCRVLLERAEAARDRIERRETLGPVLFSSVIAERGLPRASGASTPVLYPIRWVEVFKLWLPEFLEEVERRLAGAWFLPVYQSFPQYLQLDETLLPPDGSYLRNLISTFASDPGGPAHDPRAIREATRRWLIANNGWAIPWLYSISGPQSLAKLIG